MIRKNLFLTPLIALAFALIFAGCTEMPDNSFAGNQRMLSAGELPKFESEPVPNLQGALKLIAEIIDEMDEEQGTFPISILSWITSILDEAENGTASGHAASPSMPSQHAARSLNVRESRISDRIYDTFGGITITGLIEKTERESFSAHDEDTDGDFSETSIVAMLTADIDFEKADFVLYGRSVLNGKFAAITTVSITTEEDVNGNGNGNENGNGNYPSGPSPSLLVASGGNEEPEFTTRITASGVNNFAFTVSNGDVGMKFILSIAVNNFNRIFDEKIDFTGLEALGRFSFSEMAGAGVFQTFRLDVFDNDNVRIINVGNFNDFVNRVFADDNGYNGDNGDNGCNCPDCDDTYCDCDNGCSDCSGCDNGDNGCQCPDCDDEYCNCINGCSDGDCDNCPVCDPDPTNSP